MLNYFNELENFDADVFAACNKELDRQQTFIELIASENIVSKAVLLLATYEMMFLEDIPAKVSINEAIELSKKYDDEKAYMLVNGVLNATAEALGLK